MFDKRVVLVVLVAAVVCDPLPLFFREWRKHSAEWVERYRFSKNEAPQLAAAYPTFMPKVLTETVDFLADTSFWHALSYSWRNMAMARGLFALATLFQSSLVRRLVSPQGWIETTVICMLAVLLCYGGYLFATNYTMITSRAKVQVAEKKRQAAKYTAKATMRSNLDDSTARLSRHLTAVFEQQQQQQQHHTDAAAALSEVITAGN